MCECLAGVGCCCFSCCCKECGEGVAKTLGRERTTKICYLFVVVVFTVPAILLFFLINNWDGFKNHFDWMACPSSSGGRYPCVEVVGSALVLRWCTG
jgi:hypothetical protein